MRLGYFCRVVECRSGGQTRGQSLYDLPVSLEEFAEAGLKLWIGLTLRDVAIEGCPGHFRGRTIVGTSDRVDFDSQLIVNPDGRDLGQIADPCTSMKPVVEGVRHRSGAIATLSATSGR
jgi:hypothetical protein